MSFWDYKLFDSEESISYGRSQQRPEMKYLSLISVLKKEKKKRGLVTNFSSNKTLSCYGTKKKKKNTFLTWSCSTESLLREDCVKQLTSLISLVLIKSE